MADTSPQTRQRAKVGAIGLALVLLLIAVASAINGTASREKPIAAPGGAKADIVANMALGNTGAAASEPLDMGISPGPQNTAAPAR